MYLFLILVLVSMQSSMYFYLVHTTTTSTVTTTSTTTTEAINLKSRDAVSESPPQKQQSPNADRGEKKSVGFVHIAKTAGSTLSMLLRNGCHSYVKPKPCHVVPNETAISRLVDSYYHVPDFQYLPQSNHQIYILSIRDVYDRTISAFLYQHPRNIPFTGCKVTPTRAEKNPIAYKCFPTLEKFASLLNKGNSSDCGYPYLHNQFFAVDCNSYACAVSITRK